GQEAVARMHTVAATGLGSLDQRFEVEIGAHGTARRRLRCAIRAGRAKRTRLPERTRFSSYASMKRERVSRSVYADRLHAERRRGVRDADSDFTSIGNQYTLEQRLTLQRHSRSAGSYYSLVARSGHWCC